MMLDSFCLFETHKLHKTTFFVSMFSYYKIQIIICAKPEIYFASKISLIFVTLTISKSKSAEFLF